MTANESRPGLETGAATQSRLTTWSQSSGTATNVDKSTRPACLRCRHPLTLPRSIARGYGRRCWRRTEQAQLDARRDGVGRLLARLAARVAVLDGAALLLVTDALQGVLEALDAEGVAA